MQKMKGDIVNTAVSYVLALGVSGLVLGAIVLAVGAFSTGQTGATLGTLNNVSAGLLNFAAQFGNMGTMAGVAILLLFVFAAIGVVGYGMIKRE